MRTPGGIIPLSVVIFAIVTIQSLTSVDGVAVGQSSSNQTTAEDRWKEANFFQKTAIQEQVEFSRLAQELQTKIADRDIYLTNLLQTANSNSPTTENIGGDSFTSECVIATAAYGSNLAPQVQFLRNFRDDQIKSTAAGTSFIEAFNLLYYSFSPSVAEYERGQPWLQQTVRVAIIPLLSILQLSENGYSLLDGESGALVSGLIASSLIGTVYFSPIAYIILSNKSSILMTRLIILFLVAAGVSLTAIVTGIFLADSSILMVATSVFMLSIVAASAISVAKFFRVLFRRKKWLIRIRLFIRRPLDRNRFASAISIVLIAIVCSLISTTAFASLSTLPQQTLSKEPIEDQLTTLGDMKSWLEETRRIESFFPYTEEAQSITNRMINLQAQYFPGGSGMTEGDYAYAVQYASDTYKNLSSKVNNDDVADRHFTVKDTLSSAILQMHYSTADEVNWRTCECDADRAQELFFSSQLALHTSTNNFYSYSMLLLGEDRQIQTYITEIETMPSS